MKKEPKPLQSPPQPMATTDEGWQNQIIAAAYDLAYQHITDGTATSQEIVFFLRLGAQQTRYEEEKLRAEVELAHAKVEAIKSSKDLAEAYQEAVKAMKEYSGKDEDYA